MRPPDTANESLHSRPDVDLVGDDLKDLLDPDAKGGGLGEEGGHGGVRGGYERDLGGPDLGADGGEGPGLARQLGRRGEDVGVGGQPAQRGVEARADRHHRHVEGGQRGAGGQQGLRVTHPDQT